MKKNTLFLAFLFLFIMFGSRAQTLVPNGPKTGLRNALVGMISEDENYIYYCDAFRDDDTYITVYDKEKHAVVNEHEIDEEYLFKTAYVRDNNLVLIGYQYNKKTKSMDYFQSSFPVMERTPRKIVKTLIYSVPATSSKDVLAKVVLSPDRTKMAFVTYTCPADKKLKTYTIDVKVCSTDGDEVMKMQRKMKGPRPIGTSTYLKNNATFFLIEQRETDQSLEDEFGVYIKDKYYNYRYITISSDGEFAPMSKMEFQMDEPIEALTPNGDLRVFGKTPTGVSILEINQTGELSWKYDFETEFPKMPKGITYQDYERDLTFIPIQILPLSDGRTIVSGTQYKLQFSDYTYYALQSLILFLFDSNGEVTTQVLPFAKLAWSYHHLEYEYPLLEWDGDIWLIYNGDKANYGSNKAKQWKRPRKHEDWCTVMERIDKDLNFTPAVLSLPPKNNANDEWFIGILNVSEDAVYYLKHQSGGNRIEKITK